MPFGSKQKSDIFPGGVGSGGSGVSASDIPLHGNQRFELSSLSSGPSLTRNNTLQTLLDKNANHIIENPQSAANSQQIIDSSCPCYGGVQEPAKNAALGQQIINLNEDKRGASGSALSYSSDGMLSIVGIKDFLPDEPAAVEGIKNILTSEVPSLKKKVNLYERNALMNGELGKGPQKPLN